MERRIYVGHKLHGSCITIAAKVYLAPAGATYDSKVRCTVNIVTVTDTGAVDDQGRTWALKGANPGCGTRCPAAHRELLVSSFLAQHGDKLPEAARAELSLGAVPSTTLGKQWLHVGEDNRRCIVKLLTPAPAAPAS